jgi:hypothetical protein
MKVIKCHKDTLDEPSASSSSFISTKANPVGRRATYESDRYISNKIFEKKLSKLFCLLEIPQLLIFIFYNLLKKSNCDPFPN